MPQWLSSIFWLVEPAAARPIAPAKPGLCIFSCCSNPAASLCHTGTAPQDIAPLAKDPERDQVTTHRTRSVYGGKSRFLCRYRSLR